MSPMGNSWAFERPAPPRYSCCECGAPVDLDGMHSDPRVVALLALCGEAEMRTDFGIDGYTSAPAYLKTTTIRQILQGR